MSEDYLWDRSGEPDPEIAHLERTLEPLRFEGLPLIAIDESPQPEPTPRPGTVHKWWPAVITAAVSVAAALLIWWWGFATGQGTADTVIVERTVAAPVVVAGAEPGDEDEDEDEDEDKDKDEDKGTDDDADLAKDADADVAGSAKDSKSTGQKSRKGKSSKSSSRTVDEPLPPMGSAKPKKARPTSSGSKSDDVDVDCILDPSQCLGSGAPKGSGHSGGSSDPNTPEKLSTSDIKAGIAPVKAKAKSCGGKHGAEPGTKVKVKLSISGRTGTVTSAAAQAPHNGTPLGNCVASALKKAKFPKFRKPSLGAVYPISM